MAVLTTMRCTIRDITLSHQTDIILKEVLAMKDDIDRLEKRNEAVEKSFEKAQHSLKQMRISTDKISYRRGKISMLTEHDIITAMVGDAVTEGESLDQKDSKEGDENIPTTQRTLNGSSTYTTHHTMCNILLLDLLLQNKGSLPTIIHLL
jgi:DNA anti-recombination protein RmuC